ncbi:MAG: transketolase C-terminal domain-containing protein [Gallionella sp.]|nr:transketolase C-terminal domain-containing protein [Gallionella sp.]
MASYLMGLQSGLAESLAASEKVLVLGEDLVDPYGGAFKVTKGLSTRFPGRVFNTPICEGGFTGVAVGMALRGYRPVVEIMFGDFLTLCTDQIVNHMAKFPSMFNGQVKVPLVIRTPMGGGRGYGATHSQSLEKMFLGLPGIKVVAPSHVHTVSEILQHAILVDDDPVLFIENKVLYPLDQPDSVYMEQSDEIPGYPTVAFRNFSSGKPDVTVFAYGGMSREIVPLLEKLHNDELNVTAVFPSCLWPIPEETLVRYGAQCDRLLICEEGSVGFNWGSEISALLYDKLWRNLNAPIARLAASSQVIPAARHLEAEVLVNTEKIEKAIWELMS